MKDKEEAGATETKDINKTNNEEPKRKTLQQIFHALNENETRDNIINIDDTSTNSASQMTETPMTQDHSTYHEMTQETISSTTAPTNEIDPSTPRSTNTQPNNTPSTTYKPHDNSSPTNVQQQNNLKSNNDEIITIDEDETNNTKPILKYLGPNSKQKNTPTQVKERSSTPNTTKPNTPSRPNIHPSTEDITNPTAEPRQTHKINRPEHNTNQSDPAQEILTKNNTADNTNTNNNEKENKQTTTRKKQKKAKNHPTSLLALESILHQINQ